MQLSNFLLFSAIGSVFAVHNQVSSYYKYDRCMGLKVEKLNNQTTDKVCVLVAYDVDHHVTGDWEKTRDSCYGHSYTQYCTNSANTGYSITNYGKDQDSYWQRTKGKFEQVGNKVCVNRCPKDIDHDIPRLHME